MYRDKLDNFEMTKKELKFPSNASLAGWKCCAESEFRYMNNEGMLPADRIEGLTDRKHSQGIPEDMHIELMWGYSAAITFVDAQLGRILDTLDELSLWNNLTVILTSDHGMHNGEKGIW